MNLTRIEVHQLGQKIGSFRSSYEEFVGLTNFRQFVLWLTTRPLDFPINLTLVTTIYLVDADEDGHPEKMEASVLVPTWKPEEQALLMQGYLMALNQIGRFLDLEHDSDHERVEGLYEILNDAERDFTHGAGWEQINQNLPWNDLQE